VPSIETADLYQSAVVWGKSTPDDYGQPRVLAPVQLAPRTTTGGVRFLKKRRDTLDSQGNKISYDATLIAAREIVPNSLVWIGTLQDLADDGHGTGTGTSDGPDSDIWEVVTADVTPDIKNRFTRWEHTMKRYKDKLPAVA
jgi:hypothetical protein